MTFGTIGLGARVGRIDETVEKLCQTIPGWSSWSSDVQLSVLRSQCFVLPVEVGNRGWVLAYAISNVPGGVLAEAPTLRVHVLDRLASQSDAEMIGKKVDALVRGLCLAGGEVVGHELVKEECPRCADKLSTPLLVLGQILLLVGRAYGLEDYPSLGSVDFLANVRGCVRRAFGMLACESGVEGARDVLQF